MVGVTLFVLFAKVSRSGGFDTQLTLTVLYNIYMWHMAYLYAPAYGKITDGDTEQEQAADQNQSEMRMMGGRPSVLGGAGTQMNMNNNPNDVSEIQMDQYEFENNPYSQAQI